MVGYIGGAADTYAIFKESATTTMEFGKRREGRNGIGQSATSPIAGTCREEQKGSRPASERFAGGAIDLIDSYAEKVSKTRGWKALIESKPHLLAEIYSKVINI